MYSLIGKTATFRQLKALDMIARLGSVSRAAEELNPTQPAVSLQVRLLEAVGAALLQRVGRGVQLTAAGEIVSRYAREILHLWSEAGDEVAALTGDLGGTLRIGAITTAEYLIPPLLVKFTATRPHVKTYFKVGNRDDIIRMLATHEIDLAVMGSAPKELRTHAVEFAKHPMVFVAAPGHPLMQRKRVALKDLESAHLLVRERGAGTRSTVESLFKNAGYRFHVGRTVEQRGDQADGRSGLGVAFLSLHACTRTAHRAARATAVPRQPDRARVVCGYARRPAHFAGHGAVPRFPDQAGRAGDRRRDGGAARAAAQVGGCVDRPVRRLKSSLLSGIDASSRSSRVQPTMRRHQAMTVAKAVRSLRGPDEGRLAAEGERAVNAARCTRH